MARRIRHAVIGAGGIGRSHVRFAASSQFAHLVAVADADPEVRGLVHERWGVPTFPNHHDLLAAGVAESVSIAVPHRTKDEISRECLEAGFHVYTEKPLAIRIATARQLVEAAERRGLELTVGHQYRTFRVSQTIKRLLDQGPIGPIRNVLWTWHHFRPQRYFQDREWVRDRREAGGGLLPLQLSHDLDLLSWFLGQPLAVTALLLDRMHGIGSEDEAAAIIEFENGAVVTLQASINRPPGYVVRQLVGDRGMIVIPSANSLVSDQPEDLWLGTFDPNLPEALQRLERSHQPGVTWKQVQLDRAAGEEPRWKRPRRVWRALGAYRNRPGLAAVLDSFFLAILGKGRSLVPGRTSLPSVEIRNAMVLSSVNRAGVAIPLDADEVDRAYDELEAINPASRELPG